MNCAGQWAKAVGALAGVTVPLHSAEHFYVVTEQIDGVRRDLPILRDPDGYTYFKEEVGGLVVGGFEPEAKPWVAPDQIPYPFEFQLLEEDWDHFSVLMESAMLRIPALRETGHPQVLQRPRELHAGQPVHPRARRRRSADFFVGAGFNSVGIASAGGAGRALAEWIVEGEPTCDLTAVDIRRFARVQRQQPLAARPGRRGARACTTRSPGPTARCGRRGRSGARPCTTVLDGRQRELRLQDGLGAAELLRPARQPRRRSTTPGASPTGCRGRRPSSEHPRRRHGLRPDLVREVPRHRARRRTRAAMAVHGRRRRRRPGGPSTPGCSTRAAATRRT